MILARDARTPARAGRTMCRESLARRPATACDYIVEIGIRGVVHDEPAARDDTQQMTELTLDGLQIGVNIRVIEFQIVEDERARMVVNELGALVEEGRVVFIGFDDEERRIAQPRADI